MTRNNCSDSKVIGLTGGIATGKSTVVAILRERGYPVIDSDKIAREVVEVGKKSYKDIVNTFGIDVLNEDLTINRRRLGEIVFNDEKKRLSLNEIVHPRVVEETIKQINQLSKNSRVIFLDIPLLIEEKNRLEALGLSFDEIWLVFADKDIQLNRIIKRDGLSKEDARKRIRAQMKIEDKKKYANKIINNMGSLEDLTRKVDKLLEDI